MIVSCSHLHPAPKESIQTDCANNGSFVSVRFVLIGCRQDPASTQNVVVLLMNAKIPCHGSYMT